MLADDFGSLASLRPSFLNSYVLVALKQDCQEEM